MRAAAVDALVVSHLPNIRYLTGFVGTAGLVVLTPTACALIVDFRYQTVARSLVAAMRSWRRKSDRGRAVSELRRDACRGAARERRTAHRHRSRVDAGQPIQPSRPSALAAAAPTPLRSPGRVPGAPADRADRSRASES